MKQLNLSTLQLYDVFNKEVRSVLEMAAPVWHSGLTKKQSNNIERIQKIAFRIILGQQYQSYNLALKALGAETLYQRRVNLCKKFATKNLKSENSFFQEVEHTVNTRSKKRTVKEFACNTDRFAKSSLPYFAKLINQN